MLFGLSYLGGNGEVPTLKTKDKFFKNYILRLSPSLSLKVCRFLAQTLPLELLMQSFHARDWVLIQI